MLMSHFLQQHDASGSEASLGTPARKLAQHLGREEQDPTAAS